MQTAQVVIIGGGVLGASVAFYLSRAGVRDVLVLERDWVAQGNSSYAAGLLTRARSSAHLIPLVLETYRAIAEIETILNDSLDLHRCGCVYAAVNRGSQADLAELAAIATQAGLPVEWPDRLQVRRLVPWLELPEEATVWWMPDDGFIDGYRLTQGYIHAARALGAKLQEETPVLSVTHQHGKVTGVHTTKGEIAAPIVIDAAGVWAGELALELGVPLPMAPVRSHYWITTWDPQISPEGSYLILPEARAYARPERNCLLFGLRELQSMGLDPSMLPDTLAGFSFNQDPYGWESLLESMPSFSEFVPLVEEVEIVQYVKGLSNYTPDGNLVLGGVPELQGFMTATGCSGAGLAMSGGVGRLLVDMVIGRQPFVDPAPHRIDRFGSIDPLSMEFIERCAAARAGKITG